MMYVGDNRSSLGTYNVNALLVEFTRRVEAEGYAITKDYRGSEPWNHRVIGVGVGHEDARFAETGQSMAAYYENGESFDRVRRIAGLAYLDRSRS